MIGRRVAQYEIVEKLGEGGMGAVYRARDTKLQREVALKALPPEHLGDPRRRERFLREARAASALNHPHIVTIHDVISDASGEFIVMECIRGNSLDARIGEAGLPAGEALAVAEQIADAVAAAHAAGLIHRDLKPPNVMITESGAAKILDFGIAKLDGSADEPTDELTALTADGAIVGTLGYMAPEQVRGEQVDRRADVFALGVILYEMLTGRRPFRGSSPATVIHEIVFAEPAPVRELRQGLPASIEVVLARALAKERDERYDSMVPFLADLRALRTAVESGAGARLPFARRRVWSRRHKRLAAVAATITVLAVGVGVLRDRLPRLVAPAGPAGEVIPDTPLGQFEHGMRLLHRFDREGAVENAQQAFQRSIALDDTYAPAYAGLARAFRYRFLETNDPIWLRQARGNAERALSLNEHLALAHGVYGEVLLESGEIDAAAAALERSLELDPTDAEARSTHGSLLAGRGRIEEAEAEFRAATDAAPDSWMAFDDLGSFFFDQARYEEARAAFETAVSLAGDSHLARRDLAGAHQMLGDLSAAARELQIALQIRPEASVFSNLGTLLFYQGLYPAAVSAFEDALDLDPNDYLLWANLGDAYRFVPDRTEAANDAYRRAVQLLDGLLEAEPASPTWRSRRAVYLAKRGDAAEALGEVAAVADGVDDLVALYRLAMAAEIAGDRSVALELLERSLAGGLPLSAVAGEPELTDLRSDPAYHRIAARYEQIP